MNPFFYFATKPEMPSARLFPRLLVLRSNRRQTRISQKPTSGPEYFRVARQPETISVLTKKM
jgi:hypothetical protein